MNKFIGGRYIPKFDGEHDKIKEYEPLTVVIKDGNSYTSKKYVPVGIEIDNENYWVLSSNFNQQLATLMNVINEIKKDYKTLKYFATPEQFDGVGDGIKDDTSALQSAIDTGKTVLLSGVYKISQITLPDNAIILGGKIICDGRIVVESSNVTINKVEIVSNGNNTLVSIRGSKGKEIKNISLSDCKLYYNKPTGSEISITLDYCENVVIKNNEIEIGGIDVRNVNYFIFKDNVFDGKLMNTNEAIHCSIGSSNVSIDNNLFKNMHFEVLDTFSGGTKISLTNNKIDTFDQGMVNVKILLRDAPYTGGSSNQPEYGYTESIIISGNVFSNFTPKIDNLNTSIVEYSFTDYRSNPIHDNDNEAKYISISNNIFTDFYNQANRVSGVSYSCINVRGSGSVITGNVFDKLDSDVINYLNCAIKVGTERNEASIVCKPENILISNNLISSKCSCILLSECNGVQVIDNQMLADTRNGITPKYGIRVLKSSENVDIIGNVVDVINTGQAISSHSNGVVLNGFNISNNTFKNGTSLNVYTVINSIISGNRFIDNVGYIMTESEMLNIVSNTFDGSKDYALILTDCNGVRISGNMAKTYTTLIRLLGNSKNVIFSENFTKRTVLKNISNLSSDNQATVLDLNNISI